jgi:hypothetical protein
VCLPNIYEAKIWFYFLFRCPRCRSASSEGKCMCFWRWLYVVSMVSGGGRNENIFQITRVRFYDLCVVISVSAAHVLALQGSALITLPFFLKNLYSSFRSCRSLSLLVLLSPWLAMIFSMTVRDKWVPVTTAWRVLRLPMEERPPIWTVAANILNKQLRTAEKGCSSRLGVGRGANKSSP